MIVSSWDRSKIYLSSLGWHLNEIFGQIKRVTDMRRKESHSRFHVELGDYVEEMGVAGELAARLELKLPLEIHTGFDNGTDLIYHGWNVDVKTTKWVDGYGYRSLQWPATKPINCDIAVVFVTDVNRWIVKPIGFAFRKEIESSPIDDTKQLPCHSIPFKKLHSVDDLKKICFKSLLGKTDQPSMRL